MRHADRELLLLLLLVVVVVEVVVVVVVVVSSPSSLFGQSKFNANSSQDTTSHKCVTITSYTNANCTYRYVCSICHFKHLVFAQVCN